jgi:hypothetical protein
MNINAKTDPRLYALTAAALRLEHLLSEKHLTDPDLIAETTIVTKGLRREINILKLQAPNPEPQES